MTSHRLTRRSFIRSLGKGTLAIAVLGPAACSDSGAATTPATTSPTPVATAAPTTISAATATTPATTDPPASTAIPATWERVALGNVSAYILASNDRATIVDTGNPGSAPEIEAALGRIGLGWASVDHVIATHLHNDHIGSFADVMGAAPVAAGYAGAADLSAINSPRPLQAVGDGDEVAGFLIIETPGHTAGHIAVLDPVGGVLVAGDALNTAGGQLAGSDPRYTADEIAADASVQKLGLLDFEVLLVGHGEPVLSGAAAAVLALADTT
jgi:glyoxylase-like metal-dependent hydrolase (beta-lactamase superfamily II)